MLWIHTSLSWGFHESFPNLRNPRIKACLRLPEAYRSLATSFVGSWCQGIPTCTLSNLTKSITRESIDDLIFSQLIKELSICLPLCARANVVYTTSPRPAHPSCMPTCGDDGTRTHDLLVANQVLHQLSYVPTLWAYIPPTTGAMVGLGGFEPPTLRLSGVRSNQLSYRPG